jgi:alpha-amylase
MPSVCFYFQVHQPYRLAPFRVLDIGTPVSYFDDAQNRAVCRKVAEKCYLPTNQVMLELLEQHPEFKIAYSISGVALEQFAEYAPEVLESFKRLAATGRVEFLAETYYHSLAALFSPQEFQAQVQKQMWLIEHHFGQIPKAFRNTELIYSNYIATLVEAMGFEVMLTEGADHILDWRSPNFIYEPLHGNLKLLLKNYKLSDDIAFRFSQRSWESWPLTPEKFAGWVHEIAGNGDTMNLFMDYETFGEHQWADTGIFEFLRALPAAILKHPDFSFATPTETARRYPPLDHLDIHLPISWADMERDLSAWLGNPMQDGAAAWVYRLSEMVLNSGNDDLIHQWRKLQTSDHFYYMCTKFWSDGDVHKYFSAYETPHEAYIYLGNVLTDLELKLDPRSRREPAAPQQPVLATSQRPKPRTSRRSK